MNENNPKWLEKSYYEGKSSSEVNWAELARSWMQKNSGSQTEVANFPPPPPPPPKTYKEDQPSANGSPFPPPPPLLPPVPPIGPSGFVPPGWIRPPAFQPPAPGFQQFIVPWAGGPIPPPATESYGAHFEGGEDEEGGEYSHYYKEWEDKKKEKNSREGDVEDVEGIPQGAMPHWLGQPSWASPSWFSHHRGQAPPFIDQQSRKKLPEWIREGLEKAELERQKELIKESKLREAEEASRVRKAAKGLGKFDTDSSDEENEDESVSDAKATKDGTGSVKVESNPKVKGDLLDDNDMEDEDLKADDEKREEIMILLRRLMTEMLLERSDKEILRLATEVLDWEEKKSAQPKILAKSSALAALSALGGDSDEDDMTDTGRIDGDVENEEKRVRAGRSDFFKAPLPQLSNSGAKSKAKISSHDDGYSTSEQNKGNTSENDSDTDSEEKAPSDDISVSAASQERGMGEGIKCKHEKGTERKLNESSNNTEKDKKEKKHRNDKESRPRDDYYRRRRHRSRSRSSGRRRFRSREYRSRRSRSRSRTPIGRRERVRHEEYKRQRERKRSESYSSSVSNKSLSTNRSVSSSGPQSYRTRKKSDEKNYYTQIRERKYRSPSRGSHSYRRSRRDSRSKKSSRHSRSRS